MARADEQTTRSSESPYRKAVLVVENKHCCRSAPTPREYFAIIKFGHQTVSISQ